MTVGPNPYPFDPRIVDRGLRAPTVTERLAGLKKMALDPDDRRALSTIGGYALLLVGVLLGLVALALALALCVRLFIIVSGLGAV